MQHGGLRVVDDNVFVLRSLLICWLNTIEVRSSYRAYLSKMAFLLYRLTQSLERGIS
jgi:hypothetical protein